MHWKWRLLITWDQQYTIQLSIILRILFSPRPYMTWTDHVDNVNCKRSFLHYLFTSNVDRQLFTSPIATPCFSKAVSATKGFFFLSAVINTRFVTNECFLRVRWSRLSEANIKAKNNWHPVNGYVFRVLYIWDDFFFFF